MDVGYGRFNLLEEHHDNIFVTIESLFCYNVGEEP